MKSRQRPFLSCASVAVVLAISLGSSQAQKSSNAAACKIKTEEPTALEVAYQRGDHDFAKQLAAARAKEPGNPLYRVLEIRSFLNSGKYRDADKKLTEWAAASPNDPYALLAASDYRHALGDWPEAYGLALKALKTDPCLAPAFVNLATFEDEAGYRATAAKHLATAYQLWPKDQNIRAEWVDSLPPAQRPEEVRQFLSDSKSIAEKNRQRLLHEAGLIEAHEQDRCELESSKGPARIPMVAIDDEGSTVWGVDVAIDGHQRTLELDSGASGINLTLAASTNLQLQPISTSRVGGFGDQGSNAVKVSMAPTVRIGGLQFKNCVVESLTSYGVMGGSSMGLGQKLDSGDGLLGSDIFARYLVTLDFIKHEIRLDPLPDNPAAPVAAADRDPLGGSNNPDWLRTDRYIAPQMKSWTKIYRDGHILIVPVVLSNNGENAMPALFVADTGSQSNLVDTTAVKAFSQVQESNTYSRGLSGMTKLSEAGAFTLDFAGIRLPVKSMDSMDLSRFGGPVGFLGQPTLEQLVIHLDYRDNLALFEAPNAKKL